MHYTLLSIGGKDLEPPISIKPLNLTGPLSAGSPALTFRPNASIYFCLVYKN